MARQKQTPGLRGHQGGQESEEKKAVFREEFREYAEKETHCIFGNLSNQQITRAMTQFYIERVHNPLRNLITEDDFDRGYVDAPRDVGVDFIHRDDGVVLIIQSKFSTHNAPAVQDHLSHFQRVLLRLHDPTITKNRKLASILYDVDFNNDIFVLQYITLAKIDHPENYVSAPVSLPASIPGLEERVSIEFLDETGLNLAYRNALKFATGIPMTPRELVAEKSLGKRSSVIEIAAGGFRSFIMVIDAQQIVNLYTSVQDALFTLNIRNYVGNTHTNRSIKTTARDSPEQFFHYNNGIACVATKVTLAKTEDRITVEGIQVINGAQTVKSLVSASKERKERSDKGPYLLLRVTEIGVGYGSDGRFRNNVIRYNNTQNIIKVSDFRSNDPIQNHLKQRFSECRRWGRPIEYQPKRTDRADNQRNHAIIIRLEEFAKSIYSFVQDPISFAGSTSFLFDDGPKGGYVHIFGDGQTVSDTMSEKEFKLKAAIYWLCVAFSERLKNEKKEVLERKQESDDNDDAEILALERKWTLIFVSRLILERAFKKDGYQEMLSKTYLGEWKFGEGEEGQFFEKLYKMAKDTVIFNYKTAKKQKNFTHSNWLRSQNTIEDLKEYVQHAPGIELQPLKK